MNRTGHPPNAAARHRRAQAEQAVISALREARKSNAPITFTGLAAAAGVSRDFIYRHPELRAQVEALRHARDTSTDAAERALIGRLSQQLMELRRQHRRETSELQRALAMAHGELLYLRRRLDDAVINP
jgi:Family of unknown function (DUF6262)